MAPTDLEVGDVVQIDPEQKDCRFKGCFMIVTDPKAWGAQGYICIPTQREETPGLAFFRATWPMIEYIGKAYWIVR